MHHGLHKSFIINVDSIHEIDARGILLLDKPDPIPFGPKYKPMLASLFKLNSSG